MLLPTYCLHRATGQAYVTVREGPNRGRRVIYLGAYGSDESRRRYAEVIARLGTPSSPPPPSGSPLVLFQPSSPTVGACFDRWAAVCLTYYRRADGTPTQEVEDHRRSWEPLLKRHRQRPIASLTRFDWTGVREVMVAKGWCRRIVNQRYGRVLFSLRHLAEEGFIPAEVVGYAKLRPLLPHRSDAPETDPVLLVPLAVVRATQAHLHPVLRQMVELQLLTGMRPGEVRELRLGDLVWDGGRGVASASGPVAIRPLYHKTSYRGRPREIPLSPSAASLLRPQVAGLRAPGDLVFPSPLSKTPGPTLISKRLYGDNIHRAARKAGVEPWGPHRVRHLSATVVRKFLSLDDARALLGHLDAWTTTTYAEVDQEAARRAVEALERALGPPPVPPSAPPPESDPR